MNFNSGEFSMNIIQRILCGPAVGIRWVKALEVSSNEDYQAALVHLDYLDKFFNGKNVEYHLLRGLVNYGLGDDLQAVNNFKISISLLADTYRYNENEKNYLTSYGVKYGTKALKNDPDLAKTISFPHIDMSSVDLSKVRKPLKINFPLRDHPNWER